MAKYDVACEKCQSTFAVQLVGPNRDRQWKLDHFTWVCDDCKELAKAEASARAAAEAEEIGLPELEGTEKQIRWAEVIRLKLIALIDEGVARWTPTPEKKQTLLEAVNAVKGHKSASFWIEHRESSAQIVIEAYLKKNPPLSPAEKDLAADASAEATVRPADPITETVAEIRPLEKRVEVSFPEKREDFWRLIKIELHFQWSGTCWTREMSIKTGPAVHRAAEVGHRLLAAGFPVSIFDSSVRGMAVSGNFEPECRKWITKLLEGRYEGWFCIRWTRDSGDFYKEAKLLPASRYHKPSVVVPAEHFEDVLDFAAVHGFRLSAGAEELAVKAKAARDAALTVYIEAPEKARKKRGKPRKPVLNVPGRVDVPDELRD